MNPSGSEVISQIANYFSQETRSSIFSRKINMKERLFQMLDVFDNASGLN